MINAAYLDKLCREYNDLDEKIHKLDTFINVHIDTETVEWKYPASWQGCTAVQCVGQLRAMKSYRRWLSSRINAYLAMRDVDEGECRLLENVYDVPDF